MREEISAAVDFLVGLVEKQGNLKEESLEKFKICLSEFLTDRYKNHWDPDRPEKGQGYRCIRLNQQDRKDNSLEKAAQACGIKMEDVKLPLELTLWIDPFEVCCRFGETLWGGSNCILASFQKNVITMDRKVEKPQETCYNNPRQTHNKRQYLQEYPQYMSGGRPGEYMGASAYPQQRLQNVNMVQHLPQHVQQFANIHSPYWMSPSPPPYHLMLQRQGGPLY